IEALKLPPGFAGDIAALWLCDGLAGADRGAAGRLADRLQRLGQLEVVAAAPSRPPVVLRAPGDAASGLVLHLERAAAGGPQHVGLRAIDDAGRLLSREQIDFAADETTATHEVKLPSELRNRIASFAIESEGSAGGVLMLDDRWRQRPVGLFAEGSGQNAQPLLSDLYYVERALAPSSELRHGDLPTLLQRDLSVLARPDVGLRPGDGGARLKTWIENGGVLVRFAGPKRAQNGQSLLPVRLRGGARQLGGAMSWSRPAKLAPFTADSPFA